MNRFSTPFLTATLVAWMVLPAQATIISVGNHTLLPNTPNQTIPILISGGGESNIVGSDLYVLVGDGGPEFTPPNWPGPTGTDAPGMEHLPGDVNLTTGTIFTGNHTTPVDQFSAEGGSIPQLVGYSVNTSSGTVSDTAPNSVLAFLTFDTTGFTHGTWPVYLDDTAVGGSDFTDLVLSGSGSFAPTLVAGSITVAPEPATLALAIAGLIPFLGWGGKRRWRGRLRMACAN